MVKLPDGRLVATWIARHYGGVVGRSANEPLSTITKKDHHGLVCTELVADKCGYVKVGRKKYRLGTTTHRMLEPRELANGMGFTDGYQMIGTKGDMTARIGNAVCPPLAKAIVGANYTPDHGDLNRGSIQTGFTTVYETEKKGVVL